MPDTTRVLRITGEAMKGLAAKRNTRKQRGGYDTVPGSVIPTPSQTPFAQLMKGGSPSSSPSPSPSVTPSASASPSATPSASASATPSASSTPSSSVVSGGARKLQLAPKKEVLKLVKKTHVKPADKVADKSADKSVDKSADKSVDKSVDKRVKTRKVIRIQMGHLRKSMKRASDINKSSKEKSIEEIEDLLVREKILRKRSADRPMSDGRQQTLRGMYRDYVQLRSNLM